MHFLAVQIFTYYDCFSDGYGHFWRLTSPFLGKGIAQLVRSSPTIATKIGLHRSAVDCVDDYSSRPWPHNGAALALGKPV